MTHIDFVHEVLKEWNLETWQLAHSCYNQWYHYTIPSGKPFPENKIIGEFTQREGKAVFVLTKRDGTEQIWEADDV